MDSEHRHSRYIWSENLNYRDLMVELMKNLEPMKFDKDQILLNELDPHLEIFFIMDDNYDVGFTINHVPIFPLIVTNVMIGAYGITFGKNSHYIYKANHNSEGFFVRR